MHITQHGPHLDFLLRQTRQHHVQLSTMADFKANVMITLSSLIITFTLDLLSDPVLRWPVITLIFFCGATIFSATWAVMPRPNMQIQPNPDDAERFNPLFFGSFVNMSYSEYKAMMEAALAEPSSVYELQVREIYQLGVFLGRTKYLYVRRAYILFLSGLLASACVLMAVELFVLAT